MEHSSTLHRRANPIYKGRSPAQPSHFQDFRSVTSNAAVRAREKERMDIMYNSKERRMHSQYVHLHPDIHGRWSSLLSLRRHDTRVAALCRGSLFLASSFTSDGRHCRGRIRRLRRDLGGVGCRRRRTRRVRFGRFLPSTLQLLLPLPVALFCSGLLTRSWRRHRRGRFRWGSRCRGHVRICRITRRRSLAVRRGSAPGWSIAIPSLRRWRRSPWWLDSCFLQEPVTNSAVILQRSAMASYGSSLAVLPQRVKSRRSCPQRSPEVRSIVIVPPGRQRRTGAFPSRR